MKKLIIGLGICIMTQSAVGALDLKNNCCLSNCPEYSTQLGVTYDEKCTTDQTLCNCDGAEVTSINGHVWEISQKNLRCKKNINNVVSATCLSMIGFACADGYYGIPESIDDQAACLPCPQNAKCSGTTFSCNTGFYKDGNECRQCPTLSGITMSAPGRTPVQGGATSITECLIYAGTAIDDETGIFEHTADCYYSE